MRISAHPVWPKILNDSHARALARELKKEGLKLTYLVASISGTEDLVAMITGYCEDDEAEYEFVATWHFDDNKISEPVGQYYLADLEIIEEV